MSRRQFLKALAAIAVLPVASVRTVPTFTVHRRNMWPHDLTSDETLARCTRLLLVDPNDVLVRVHRGSVPEIYYDSKKAWADLSRAITLEPQNPCIWYVRGTCFDRADDLRHAVNLLLNNGGGTGKAICSSIPDHYIWRGTEAGEMVYLSSRELGYAEEQAGHFSEAIAAYRKAAAFETISLTDMETWAEASFLVGSWGRASVEYERLIAMQPKMEYNQRLTTCLARLSGARSLCVSGNGLEAKCLH